MQIKLKTYKLMSYKNLEDNIRWILKKNFVKFSGSKHLLNYTT